jgi:hypothetical protein
MRVAARRLPYGVEFRFGADPLGEESELFKETEPWRDPLNEF